MNEIIGQVVEWATRFDWLKVLIPIIVSFIVLGFFARTMRQMINQAVGPDGELKRSMNEALGAFRVEFRQLLNEERRRHKAKLMRDFRSVDKSAEDEERKRAIAKSAAELPETTSVVIDSDENEKNLGELRAMWEKVWSWTKEQLTLALNEDKRGVVLGKLKNADKRSAADLISMLYRYGWYGDESSDLALEMAGIFNRHKNKRLPVDSDTIEKFRDLFARWEEIDN